MTNQTDLAPDMLSLYSVFYDAGHPDYDDDEDAWQVGLEDGCPIAICFSDQDANTVAAALNNERLAPIADADLITSFQKKDGESGSACALLAEIRRRHLAI